jgi:hypothetical protein
VKFVCVKCYYYCANQTPHLFGLLLHAQTQITQEGEPDDVVERILAESLQLHKLIATTTDGGDACTTELVKVAALKKEVCVFAPHCITHYSNSSSQTQCNMNKVSSCS